MSTLINGMLKRFNQREECKPPEKRLGQDAKVSLVIHFFFQFGASMSGIFMNLYLWRLTGDLFINGMYNIINFAVSACGFVLGGWLAKKKDRMVTYRLGLLLTAMFYICVILAQEQVAVWYQLFAVFAGISGAFYWSGYLILMYDVSDDRNRIHYMAMNSIFFTAAGLIGPAIAGRVIASYDGLHGYIIVFGISFIMFLLAAVGSLKIRPNPNRHRTFYLKHSILIMKRNPMWLRGLISFFVLGLLQGIMLFLPNILMYEVMPHEDKIGYMTVLFSLISILMGVLISKYASDERAPLYLWISGLGLLGASMLLLFGLHVWSVMAFMVLFSFFAPLQGNTLSSRYYRQVGRLPLKGNFRAESVVVREIFLNTGRIVSIASLIMLLGSVDGDRLAWILMAGAVLQLLMPGLMREPRREDLQTIKNKAVDI